MAPLLPAAYGTHPGLVLHGEGALKYGSRAKWYNYCQLIDKVWLISKWSVFGREVQKGGGTDGCAKSLQSQTLHTSALNPNALD